MNKIIFILESTFKFIKWGMGSGLLLGLVFCFLLFLPWLATDVTSGAVPVQEIPDNIFFICVIGIIPMLPGFAMGILIGFWDGIVFSIITLIFFNPPQDVQLYRMEIGFAIGVLTFCLFIIGLDRLFDDVELFDESTLIAALLATGGAVFASQRIAKAYLEDLN